MVDANALDLAVKITDDVAKRDAALPSMDDVKSLPGARVVHDAEGTGYTVHVPQGNSVRAMDEMLRPWRRRAEDVGHKVHSGTDTVVMTVMGAQREVPVGAERRLYAAGFRARIKGRRRRITSESEIRARIEADK